MHRDIALRRSRSFVFLMPRTALIVGAVRRRTPPAAAAAASADLQGAGRLRRGRRRRHRPAGQVRPRPEEGGLPGASRTASRRRSAPSRWSTSRSSAPIGRSSPSAPIEPDVKTNERAVRRPRLRDGARRPAHRASAARRASKIAAKQFIERRLGANDLMAIVHTGGRQQRQPGIHQQQAAAARGGRQDSCGRKLDSATANRDQRVLPARATCASSGDRDQRSGRPERAFNARSTLDTLQQRRRVVRRRPRPPQDDPVRQRRDRLRHPRHHPADRLDARRRVDVLDATRDAIAAATRSNVSDLRHRPARPDRPRRRDRSRSSRSPTTRRSASAPARCRTSCACRRTACGRSSEETGGFAVVNSNDFASAFERIVEDNSSYYVLAYYPPDAQAGAVPQDRGQACRGPASIVRARRGLRHAEESAAADRRRKNDSPSTPEVNEALDSPLPVSGLTMHVFAAPFKGTAPNASVLFGVEMRGRDLQLEPNSKIVSCRTSPSTRTARSAAATPTR